MKKTVILLFVLMMTAMTLVGCSENDRNKMKEDVSAIVSEAKDNLNDMIDNATVSDGDGHIGENKSDEASTPADVREEMTEDDVTGEGLIDGSGAIIDETTAPGDMTQNDAFI